MKKLIILFGILFLTGCGFTSDYRNDLARFELLSKCFDQLNTFYTTEGSEIAIHIHTMDSISSVDSIDTVLSGRHEETLYKGRYGDTRKMSEKIKSLLD